MTELYLLSGAKLQVKETAKEILKISDRERGLYITLNRLHEREKRGEPLGVTETIYKQVFINPEFIVAFDEWS